jgi:hypothetical protein
MANGHGGKRPGSGRKRSPAREKTREVADRLVVEKPLTPLDVMVEAMLHHHKHGRLDKAAAIAKDAAPYMHPRLSYVKSDVSHSDAELERVLEDELAQLSRERAAADGAVPADQGPSAESSGNGQAHP